MNAGREGSVHWRDYQNSGYTMVLGRNFNRIDLGCMDPPLH